MKTSLSFRISFWASRHRALAIVCIVLAKVTVGIVGFNLGIWAAMEGLALSSQWKWPLAAIAGACLWAYPARRLKSRLGKMAFFRRQKSIDGALATLGLVFFFWLGNLVPYSNLHQQSQPTPVQSLMASMQREGIANQAVEDSAKPIKAQKKTRVGKLKQWFAAKIKKRIERKMERFARLAGNTDTPEKILLTFLLLLLAFIAVYLVALLSCNLACNGQETLAIFVATVGGVGIIIGLIYGFGAIWRNKHDAADIERRKQENRKPTEIQD